MKAARGHAGLVGQDFRGECARQILRHPLQQRSELRSALQRKQVAVLRLPARATHGDHEATRDADRNRRTKIILDQRQRQIDAGPVTPADVHTLPSRTQIGSARTRTRGNSTAS